MTELQLYKFVHENNVEYHWNFNDSEEGEVYMMPYIFQVEEFNKLLCKSVFDDYGIDCKMMDGYFCFAMREICEYEGIELENVFPDKKA